MTNERRLDSSLTPSQTCVQRVIRGASLFGVAVFLLGLDLEGLAVWLYLLDQPPWVSPSSWRLNEPVLRAV